VSNIWNKSLFDAVLLLHDFLPPERFSFCTTEIGAKESYKDFDFYSKEIDGDTVRVNKSFAEASKNGLTVLHKTLSLEAIRTLLLSAQVIMIMLVDLTELRDISLLAGKTYRGHYILVCGYCQDREEFALQDPSSSTGQLIFIGAEALDRARKSEGTDEDLILFSCEQASQAQQEAYS
jgi:hypothetical protein